MKKGYFLLFTYVLFIQKKNIYIYPDSNYNINKKPLFNFSKVWSKILWLQLRMAGCKPMGNKNNCLHGSSYLHYRFNYFCYYLCVHKFLVDLSKSWTKKTAVLYTRGKEAKVYLPHSKIQRQMRVSIVKLFYSQI